MSYLGIHRGNKPYLCPIFGNQNTVTLGGTNKLVHQPVPFLLVETSQTLMHTEVEQEDDQIEHQLATHALYEERKKVACAYLISFMGAFWKSRPELLALQILQAVVKRCLKRFEYVGMRLTKRKIGDDALNGEK